MEDLQTLINRRKAFDTNVLHYDLLNGHINASNLKLNINVPSPLLRDHRGLSKPLRNSLTVVAFYLLIFAMLTILILGEKYSVTLNKNI